MLSQPISSKMMDNINTTSCPNNIIVTKRPQCDRNNNYKINYLKFDRGVLCLFMNYMDKIIVTIVAMGKVIKQ